MKQIDKNAMREIFAELQDGAFGVKITEKSDCLIVESFDPVLSLNEVSDLMRISTGCVRGLVNRGVLHPFKSAATSGTARFRKSRLLADLSKMELLS